MKGEEERSNAINQPTIREMSETQQQVVEQSSKKKFWALAQWAAPKTQYIDCSQRNAHFHLLPWLTDFTQGVKSGKRLKEIHCFCDLYNQERNKMQNNKPRRIPTQLDNKESFAALFWFQTWYKRSKHMSQSSHWKKKKKKKLKTTTWINKPKDTEVMSKEVHRNGEGGGGQDSCQVHLPLQLSACLQCKIML